ncbi:hypothetical protein [Helicobacter ganmani]|nr:hypothetical protein [Helicobacter ganmani]
MAYIRSKTLFFTTSPRTPLKMLPELKYYLTFKIKSGIWNHK